MCERVSAILASSWIGFRSQKSVLMVMEWHTLWAGQSMSVSHACTTNHRVLRFDARHLCTLEEMQSVIDVAVAYFSNLGSGEGAYVFTVVADGLEMPSLQHFALAVRTMIACKRLIHSHVCGTVILTTDSTVAVVLRLVKTMYTFQRPVCLFRSMAECERVLHT